WSLLTVGTSRYAQMAKALVSVSPSRDHAAILSNGRRHLDALLSLARQVPTLADSRAEELLTTILEWEATSSRTLLSRHEALMQAKDEEANLLRMRLGAARAQWLRMSLRGRGEEPAEQYRQQLTRFQREQDDVERQIARLLERSGSAPQWTA